MHATHRVRPALLWAMIAALGVLSGCGSDGKPSGSTSPSGGPVTTQQGSAAAALARLPDKGRAPKTGYARAAFGVAWADLTNELWGGNGVDTRDDVLSRDLSAISCKTKPSVRSVSHCVVSRGMLHDPYTGAIIRFSRGANTSAAVQIDHVVALSDSWQTGAQQLTSVQRIDLANDPLNLIAVDGPTNTAKSDSDAASWLPPNKAFRCSYVARQIAVKAKYHLWLTRAEHAAMARVLSACPNQPLPTALEASRRTY